MATIGQRILGGGQTRRGSRSWVLHKSRATGPHPSGPAETHPYVPYGVHMRNTSGPGRDTWATYVQAAREHAGLNKTELARRIGKDRATIGRWEDGKNRPEDANLVARFADVLGLDRDEALAAAGLRPDVEPPAAPTVEIDEEITLVRTDPNLTEAMKERIIALIHERRAREKATAIEETRRLIDLFRRS